MKRFTSIVRKRSGPAVQSQTPVDPNGSPEDNATRGVRLFCESGSQNSNDGEGQEYLHLPVIVESAESSPAAAKASANTIRKLIKDSYSKPYIQYNAIMLIRILADNPGPSFTKNMDEKFITTLKTLLQQGRDPSVRQLLIETLHALETEKAYDKNLVPLTAMWLKERGLMMNAAPQQSRFASFAPNPGMAAPGNLPKPRNHLPPPAELAGRIEEARTSAQLLTQLTQTTPPSQVVANDLMKEFAHRCQTAQRTLQAYMNCTDPAPDEPTFQTLIEVSEQLNIAMSKHQRAILAARKESAQSPPAATQSPPLVAAGPPPPIESHPMWQQQQQGPTQFQPGDPPAAPRNTNPFLASPRSPTITSTNGSSKQPVTVYPAATVPRQPSKPLPTNPFSDDNQIPSRTPSTQQIPKPQSSAHAVDQNSSEIGATLAGPAPHSSLPLSNLNLDDEEFEPPPGPPPKKSNTDPLGQAFSYNPSGAAGLSNRPATQESEDDLYGTNPSPVSPMRPEVTPKDANGSAVAAQHQSYRPSQSASYPPPSGPGRIIDDEPMSPMPPSTWGTRES